MSENTPDIGLREAQGAVDRWIGTIGVRYFSPLTNMAVLTEEVGEVARIMARTYGDQSAKPGDKGADALADELADSNVRNDRPMGRANGMQVRCVKAK